MEGREELMKNGQITKEVSESPKIVRVTFNDPTQFDGRYGDTGDPIECTTIGWLEELDKEKVKLAWMYDADEEHSASGLLLPKGCIKEITDIEDNSIVASQSQGRKPYL